MKRLFFLSLLWAWGLSWSLALPAQFSGALRSLSGQFTVLDVRTGSSLRPGQTPDPQALELSQPFLVVSCERIKQALYDDMGLGREWRGTIRVALRSWTPGATASINAERFGSGWVYQLNLPEWIDRGQFMRSLVQVLLLEVANRTTTGRSAEVPLWLSEGLTQRLLASREVELILPPPKLNIRGLAIGPTVLQKRDPDPLEAVRLKLRERPALTISELSWPAPERFSPDEAAFFQGCAQLFTTELLQLKNGPEHLRQLLGRLALFYNWQSAFWRAYEAHFPNQLALEKWWALQTAHFAGRDHRQLWSVAESAQQLEALLQTPVAVRATRGEMPVRAQVNLTTVIADWDVVRQMATLPGKLRDLEQAQLRVAPEFMILVSDYRRWLEEYLQQRSKFPATFARGGQRPSGLQKLVQGTLAQLEQLEARRKALAESLVEAEAKPATDLAP
jgi:hypothetical protein